MAKGGLNFGARLVSLLEAPAGRRLLDRDGGRALDFFLGA